MVDDHGQQAVALGRQIDAVDRIRLRGAGVELLRRVKKIDEPDAMGPCYRAHGRSDSLEPGVVLRAVGQRAIVQVLMGDRREEDEPGRARAVVLLPERMSDEGGKSFPETVQVAERLVVAEEGENDVGLGPAQPFVGRAEIGRAEADSQLVG